MFFSHSDLLSRCDRVQTSYVKVEPKRRRPQESHAAHAPMTPGYGRGQGRELRRARIVITVKRTQSYKRWLEENPLQAVVVGDGDEGGNDDNDEAVAER